jgi:hypothetical protein
MLDVMSEETATEPTKTALENSVAWFLADKLHDPSVTIATKKYLTNQNRLIHLTVCNVVETNIPKVKLQVFDRVKGGVHETGYRLFADHRFEKYQNDMIFGTEPGTATGDVSEQVSEMEAQQLLALVNSLTTARQTL